MMTFRRYFRTCPFLAAAAAAMLLAAACDRATREAEETEASPDASSVPVSPEGASLEGTPWPQLSPEQQREVLDRILQVKARQQAEGLAGGSVRVNGAWNYTGYSFLSPNPEAAIEARLVAVDVTVSGHNEHFDYDDIEIVDGASLMSYGSDPHLTPLTPDGRVLSEGEFLASAPYASRWLLIYAYPKASSSFHLYYWGRQLTPSPVPIAERGMELPYPAPAPE